jgi:hypothetical protein
MLLSFHEFIYFVFGGAGLLNSASHLQSRHSTTRAIPPVHFVLVILEMESLDVFAQDDFELQFS